MDQKKEQSISLLKKMLKTTMSLRIFTRMQRYVLLHPRYLPIHHGVQPIPTVPYNEFILGIFTFLTSSTMKQV